MIDVLARNGSDSTCVRVELRESALEDVMRLLPSRPDFPPEDRQEIHAAWEPLAALVRSPHGPAAAHARSMLQWDEMPECLASLVDGIAAEFLVVTDQHGEPTLRWWVSGDSGWVGLALVAGEVRLVPSSREDIRRGVLEDIAAAIGQG